MLGAISWTHSFCPAKRSMGQSFGGSRRLRSGTGGDDYGGKESTPTATRIRRTTRGRSPWNLMEMRILAVGGRLGPLVLAKCEETAAQHRAPRR